MMKPMHAFCAVLALLSLDATCTAVPPGSAAGGRNRPAGAACSVELETVGDIPYYPALYPSDGKGDRATQCRLDLRRPKGVKDFQTVVWFHGGGLCRGSRNFVGVDFFDKKIATVSADYRLMNETNSIRAADCITDAAAAVAWTLDNIAKYGGDPSKVYVAGSSAGGYLAMMIGMDPRWLAKFSHRPLDLAGIAPNSGQATTHFNVKRFNGDKRTRWQPVIDEWAPLYYCDNWKEIPPMAVICGESPWEMQARAEENKLLVASLRALGHRKVWYVSLPYASHGRTTLAGAPYIEYFVKGDYPEALENSVAK